MQLAQTLIETRCHVCAFFQRSNEEYKILVPFLKQGIDTGDKVVDILGPERRAEHLRRLTEAGVPVKKASATASSICASGRRPICETVASIDAT